MNLQRGFQKLVLREQISLVALFLIAFLLVQCSKVEEPNYYNYKDRVSLVDIDPSWSPDGQWIVYYHGESGREGQSGLYKIRPDRTGNIFLADFGKMPKWSPNGEKIVYKKLFDNQHLYIYDTNTGLSNRITDDSLEKVNPTWHPNGLEILYSVRIGPDSVAGIWSFHLETSEHTRIVPIRGLYPSVDPSGLKIAFIEEQTTTTYLSEFNVETKSINRLIDAEELDAHALEYPSYDKDGKRILFQTHQSGYPITREAQTWVYDVEGKTLTLLVDGSYTPAWSPDGTEIVFTRFMLYDQQDVAGNGYLYIMNIEKRIPRRLTYSFGKEGSNNE